MLKKLKVISNFLIECFMFGCAGIIGVLFIPFVIAAAWVELFKEAKDEFMRMPEVSEEDEEASEEV